MRTSYIAYHNDEVAAGVAAFKSGTALATGLREYRWLRAFSTIPVFVEFS